MKISARVLTDADLSILANVPPDVFDDPINEASAEKFLREPNCVLVAAFDEGQGNIIGFASAMTYLHPDKSQPEMVILEVGVAEPFRRHGAGKKIMDVMLAEAKNAGCKTAWLATEPDNVAALALYKAVGGKPPETCIHIDFDLTDDED